MGELNIFNMSPASAMICVPYRCNLRSSFTSNTRFNTILFDFDGELFELLVLLVLLEVSLFDVLLCSISGFDAEDLMDSALSDSVGLVFDLELEFASMLISLSLVGLPLAVVASAMLQVSFLST